MDPRIRLILEAFDTAGAALAVGKEVMLGDIGDPVELLPLAERMVTQGWLRGGRAPNVFSRTEDGRLALAGPLDLTLYTRPGCHLCEEMKEKAAPLVQRAGARLTEVNIDADAALRARYDVEVPVLLLGTRKIAKYHLDPEQFRRQLDEARKGVVAAR
jgi:glutaredoxin